MVARKSQKKRDPNQLPKSLNPERVLQALKEWEITKAQFRKAYDATAKTRGAGLRTPPDRMVRAYARFERDTDFGAFCAALGIDSQRGNAALGRMVRWNAARQR
jgi:hypothetical protein